MSLLIMLGCLTLSAVWFRPWRVRPRPFDEGPSSFSGSAGGGRASSARPRQLGKSSAEREGSVRHKPIMLVGAFVGVVVVGLLQPLLAVVLVAIYAYVFMKGRRKVVEPNAEVVKTLPEVVDLLLVGVRAGFTARETLQRCRSWLPQPFAEAVSSALHRAKGGATFAEALDLAMSPLGERVRPLIAALNAGERDGSTLAMGLLRVSDDARLRRRVAAQERARRIPVLMLGPLLLCVLPSFALLTIAPLVFGSLQDLGVVT